MRKRRFVTGLAIVVAAGVLALGPALSASAHDYLVASTPENASTQTTPLKKIVLTFDDRVLDLSGDGSSNVVEVTNDKGRHFEAGCAVIADTDVTVATDLGGSGKYTVTWQIVSADGHVVSSSIGFDYRLPAGVTPSAGKASRPACGGSSGSGSGSSGSSSSSASTTAAGAGSSNGSSGTSSGTSALGPALGIGGGVIVVALIAVVIVLVRNRRPTAPPE